MADDKKNIPDAGKVDEPTNPGKVEPAKADSPVRDQPAPAKTEAPVVEGAPQSGKSEKQTTIPGMGAPAPAGKVVDFSAVRDGATKGKPPEKAAAQDKGKQADKAKDAAKPRRGRPPKADKAAPDKAKPQPRDKMSQSKPSAGKDAPATAEAPAATEQPPAPRDAARGVKEEIVYLNLSELHPFKNHPFGVRDDAEMQGLVESVKAAGVNQPALVRPREGGGYEIIAGHRRQRASELAGFVNMPCIVRNMTDDEAILAMTDDNLRHRERILPTEKAAARGRRSRARARSKPQSPAWELLPLLERWWIFPLSGMGRRRASLRKKLRPRIRASRRIKRRMRPSPAGAAHPRLTRRPLTRPSRNLGTKCPKANRLPGKTLPPRRRPRLQPSSRPPLGTLPVA